MTKTPLFLGLAVLFAIVVKPSAFGVPSQQQEKPSAAETVRVTSVAQIAFSWWKAHSHGFPEQNLSEPTNWLLLNDSLAADGVTTYVSMNSEESGNWFVEVAMDRRGIYQVSAPIDGDFSLMFIVYLNPRGEAPVILEVRFEYPIVSWSQVE